jgi:Zn-dependent M28 family amino/carboxypeptidase
VACTFRLKADNAYAAGAVGVLVYNNVAGALNGTLGEADGLDQIPVFGIPQALGEQLVAAMASGPVVMRMFANTGVENLPTRNVLAETAGGDPNNVVMVGAHLDSVTAGPGIQDNGSGSAAILETAIQMAKVKPWNKVRFAWWSAEESGLVGSTRWVNEQSNAELDKIALYLNFDMIGSPNYGLFVYDGDNSAFPVGTGIAAGPPGSDVIERVFYGFFERVGEYAEPTGFTGRSDYGPFIAKGIASGGLFTGAEQPKTAAQVIKWGGTAGLAYDPCYHAACDTFDNVSEEALDVNSDAVAHSTITFAQSTEIINDVRGKGNFKRPYQGASDGSGTGSGGGLHDEHWDEES